MQHWAQTKDVSEIAYFSTIVIVCEKQCVTK